jgi:hypothetical protein
MGISFLQFGQAAAIYHSPSLKVEGNIEELLSETALVAGRIVEAGKHSGPHSDAEVRS